MMKLRKLFSALTAATLVTAISVSAYAATYSTPAEAAAGVTGKTQEEVTTLRQSGKTYGTIAAEANKLDAFKEAVLEIKSDRLKELVKDGRMTQAKADELLKSIKERQASCTGTGNGGSGLGLGIGGFGSGQGAGRNGDTGRGMGLGGQRLQDGSCYVQ